MDRAPSKLPNTSSRLIAMAVSLVGSAGEVQALMRSSDEDFRLYCDGSKEPSWAELDRLISVIIREQGARIARNREFLSAARSKSARR